MVSCWIIKPEVLEWDRGNTIRVGQKLAIYVAPSKAKQFKKINSMSFAEKQRSIGKAVSASAQTNIQPQSNTPDTGEYVYYKVKYGDSIWEIAKKFPGVSDQDILRLNNLSNGDRIHPGQ